ncbi:hypothetical protein IWX90DRAFT_13029 [Phyllosticta citrichinensis]|uniref:Uncharacterized protein n=1 Tax=Phyllosticta citrichinensis TaxID=1130410 RepID=A0ABR1Y6L8_9PEZI
MLGPSGGASQKPRRRSERSHTQSVDTFLGCEDRLIDMDVLTFDFFLILFPATISLYDFERLTLSKCTDDIVSVRKLAHVCHGCDPILERPRITLPVLAMCHGQENKELRQSSPTSFASRRPLLRGCKDLEMNDSKQVCCPIPPSPTRMPRDLTRVEVLRICLPRRVSSKTPQDDGLTDSMKRVHKRTVSRIDRFERLRDR